MREFIVRVSDVVTKEDLEQILKAALDQISNIFIEELKTTKKGG